MPLPRVLFFNVNGSGMGHMSRCLAYARRLRGRVEPVFFSLASAVEMIEEMGFAAEYFVSHYWSANSTFSWNSELAVRFGMVLEQVRPAVVVFDGTWPFQGFLHACAVNQVPSLVWSNRGLLKADAKAVPVDEAQFDCVLVPGEVGADMREEGRRLYVPPVCLLDEAELLPREAARAELGLEASKRYALFSLGPGNVKDVAGIGQGLVRELAAAGVQILWAQPPITVRDVALPEGARGLARYPLVRVLRAFDVFVGAAGYNTCCEVVQAQIPSLLVPNTLLADDQLRRATALTHHAPVVVSACETAAQQREAVQQVLALSAGQQASVAMDGAQQAAARIAALAERQCKK